MSISAAFSPILPKILTMAYYKIINGIRYDRALLDAADSYTKGRGEWQISLQEIQSLYTIATDAKTVTETEWRTLRYIVQNYPLTESAQKWFEEKSQGTSELTAIDALMTRIVREEFGFSGLRWQIDAEEANRQNKNITNIVDFPTAVRGALRAYLERGLNQLSLEAVVARRISGEETPAENRQNVRKFMNEGTLYLVPERPADRKAFELDLPDSLNLDGVWYFVLEIPTFSPVLFLAQGIRYNPPFFSNIGYISRRFDTDELIFKVVRQLTQFTRLQWDIDQEELARQLQIREGQNFGEALFAALYVGIFNGESSFSFRDFIRQDIWQDPDRDLDFYMREYIETGTLSLLSPQTGMVDFKIPANLVPDFDFNWVFGLEMPRKTDARFVITAWRMPNIDYSWCDGFIPVQRSFEEQIQLVKEEFNLPTLQIIASETEFEAQRQQFGADFRTFTSLLRQALNTILHDYLNPTSVFNTVAKVHIENVNPAHFDDPQEYRAAIKQLIINYLKTGSLEFLPIELPDNNPVDGESIEEFWQFFGYLPDLSDIGFWVIIARYPDDGQLPYCYGFN